MYDIDLSLNTMAYDCFELARGYITDDDTLDYRQFKFWIINQRALWLRNEFNKAGHTIDEGFVQDLGCVKMEVADAAQCCNITSGCSLLKSSLPIPQTIEQYQSPTFVRVGPVNRSQANWKLISPSAVPFVNAGRFDKMTIYPFLMNGYMFLRFHPDNQDAKLIEYINIRGVFEDPTQVRHFTSCTGTSCYTDDDRFPLNRWLYDYLKSKVVSSNITMELMNSSDTSNDSGSGAAAISDKRAQTIQKATKTAGS